jgi:uncharacterized protein YdhG (YjbR/CyaY superfamily)
MTSFAELIAAADQSGAAALTEILAVAYERSPGAVESVSYGLPTLHHQGRPVLGIGTNAAGFSIFPFSPAVVAQVRDQLSGFRITKGSIGFSADHRIPELVVAQIVDLRLAEIERSTP